MKKRLLALLLAVALVAAMVPLGASAASVKFTDVKAGANYEKAVAWAVENKVTAGTTPTTFDPEGTLKRQDTVTFLFRAAGAETPTGRENPFSDVKSGEYYTGAILWAVDKEIARGTSTTSFSPLRSVTKCELAAFLYRWKNN